MENVKKRKMQYPNTLPMRSFRKNLGTGRDRAALQHSITPSCQIRIGITFLIAFFCLATLVYASPFKGPWDGGSSKKICQKHVDHMANTKLQCCHCEERSDVAIYPIEPALVRHDLDMLQFPLILQECLDITIFIKARSGPGIASHSFAMTSINSSRLNATWYNNPLRFLVKAYKNYISPIDGKNCPMYPTCSEYSLQCFKKHGFFIGWMMTCDRLFRCGRDELHLSREIMVNGELKCYDPLENNDFWWYNGR